MGIDITVQFPEKRSLGSLYTAEVQFPHPRKWVGEARGKVELSFPDERMLGVALGAFGWEALAEANCEQLTCLRSIDFSTSQFCDRTLKSVASLSEVSEMRLDFLKFGDAGLGDLKDFPLLKTVWLIGTQITDKGLSALCALPSLANLVLKSTNITDAGLDKIKDTKLCSITLPTHISDAGLSALSAIRSLKRLDLTATAVTNEGLSALVSLPELEELYLSDTAIGDAGVAHLVKIKSLRTLFLSGTKVSDAALALFESMTWLEHLELRDTGVTEIAIARLRSKLSKCSIFGG